MRLNAILIIIPFMLMSLSNCSTEMDDTSSELNLPDLVSIKVTPTDQTLETGIFWQYSAEGEYDDSSTKDITEEVRWSTSDSNLASISNNENTKGELLTESQGGPISITAFHSSSSISSEDSNQSATLTIVPGGIDIINNYGQDLVIEVWAGSQLDYIDGIIYANNLLKIFPSQPTPATIASGTNLLVFSLEKSQTILIVLGIDFEGSYFYITYGVLSNASNDKIISISLYGEIEMN